MEKKDNEDSGRNPASSPARPSPGSGEALPSQKSQPSEDIPPPKDGDNSRAAPIDSMAAAVLQRQQEDQQIMKARMLMQQRQVEESLLAAAMARASHNMMSSGLNPHPDACLYQQALMSGRGGMFPGALYGGLRPDLGGVSQQPPLGSVMPPDTSTAPPPKSPAASRKKSSDESGTESDISESEAREQKAAFKKKMPDYTKSAKNRPYFDASLQPDPLTDGEESDADDSDVKDGRGISKARQGESFPKKLYRMIEEAKNDSKEDIISFLPHGRAFIIHKPKEFIAELMYVQFST